MAELLAVERTTSLLSTDLWCRLFCSTQSRSQGAWNVDVELVWERNSFPYLQNGARNSFPVLIKLSDNQNENTPYCNWRQSFTVCQSVSRTFPLVTWLRSLEAVRLESQGTYVHVMWLSGRISLRDHICPWSCTDTAQFAVLKRPILFLSSLLMVGRQQIQYSGNHGQ